MNEYELIFSLFSFYLPFAEKKKNIRHTGCLKGIRFCRYQQNMPSAALPSAGVKTLSSFASCRYLLLLRVVKSCCSSNVSKVHQITAAAKGCGFFSGFHWLSIVTQGSGWCYGWTCHKELIFFLLCISNQSCIERNMPVSVVIPLWKQKHKWAQLTVNKSEINEDLSLIIRHGGKVALSVSPLRGKNLRLMPQCGRKRARVLNQGSSVNFRVSARAHTRRHGRARPLHLSRGDRIALFPNMNGMFHFVSISQIEKSDEQIASIALTKTLSFLDERNLLLLLLYM